jgi:hypothetical protein
MPQQANYGGFDAFVRKYDADGNELWTRQFGTTGDDFARAISVYTSSVDGSEVYVTGDTLGDAFVRKFDKDGNELWTRQFGTEDGDNAFGVSVDSSGVYVAGATFGTFQGQESYGGRDAFVRKYDLDGTERWTRQFGAPVVDYRFDEDYASSISVSESGVYVAGYSDNAFPGQYGLWLGFVRKYDVRGNEVWTRQSYVGEEGFLSFVHSVSADASGVYVAGKTGDGDLGWDAFVRKYDSEGNESWTHWFTPFDRFDDSANGVSADGSGVYVVGSTSMWDDSDVFVAKLDRAPAVVGVDLGQDLASLIVQLSNDDLDPALAGNSDNYRLVVANGDGNGNGDPFDDGDEAIVPWAAVDPITYDPTADRITLRIAADKLFEDYYRLELDGDGLDGPDLDLAGNSIPGGTPGLADLRGNFLEGGDFVAGLDLTSLGMVDELVGKVEDLGLSTGTESSLVGKLETAVKLLGMDVGNQNGLIALLNAFKRGVVHWYERQEISESERDELTANADLILAMIMLETP